MIQVSFYHNPSKERTKKLNFASSLSYSSILEKLRKEDTWDLLDSQPSLLDEF